MINHSVTFHREVRHDFPTFEEGAKMAIAALPLLGLFRPFRGPLSAGLSVVRSITHAVCIKQCLQKGEYLEGATHLFHAALAVTALVLFFFNPVFTFVFSSVSDLIMNTRQLIENIKSKDWEGVLVTLAFISLDVLFIVSLCLGRIEITVACMALQIILDLYLGARHLEKGEYFEGICQFLLAGGHTHQLIPQAKLMTWTWKYKPTVTGTLRQGKQGFVYLDLPDEDLRALNKLYQDQHIELPPYFGKNRAGAHVSVMSKNETETLGGIKVSEIGKKYTFRIVSYDSVKPEGMSGVDRVHYLTLDSPGLESLRSKYGLSNKIAGHDFHFTFGINPTTVKTSESGYANSSSFKNKVQQIQNLLTACKMQA